MKKILIVEDDPDINKALRIRLESNGYEVHSAEDAYLGLRVALDVSPDLMLLDVSMPAGDGFSIVERLRGQSDEPYIPFIILTASKRADYINSAKDLGAAAYFEKPFDSAELLSQIDEVLAGPPNVEA